MTETRLTTDGLPPMQFTPGLASMIQGLYPADDASPRGKSPGGTPDVPATPDLASAIQDLYSSGSTDRHGEDPGEPFMLVANGIALSGPDVTPSVPGHDYEIYDKPVDHLAGPSVPGSGPDTCLLRYEDGDLWFPGIAGSRVSLARFDGGKLMDIDTGTVSEQDVSALRVLFGAIPESVPGGTASKPEGRIGLDLILELTGHGSVGRDDRTRLARDEMSRFNGLIGKAADRSICHMIDQPVPQYPAQDGHMTAPPVSTGHGCLRLPAPERSCAERYARNQESRKQK